MANRIDKLQFLSFIHVLVYKHGREMSVLFFMYEQFYVVKDDNVLKICYCIFTM